MPDDEFLLDARKDSLQIFGPRLLIAAQLPSTEDWFPATLIDRSPFIHIRTSILQLLQEALLYNG